MDITLDEIKSQCRIDGDSEDELLKIFLSAAKLAIGNHIKCKLFTELPTDNVPYNALEIDDDLKVAILMLVAYFYENRSGFNESSQVQFSTLPPTIKILVEPYTNIVL